MLAIAFVTVILVRTKEPVRHEYPVRFQVPVPENVQLSPADLPVLSPDGRRLAFAGSAWDGIRHLWVHSFDSSGTQMVPGTEGCFSPFWSPDSRFVGFGALGKKFRGAVKKIDVINGGPPMTVCEMKGFMVGGAWSPAGVILFTQFTADTIDLFRVSASGGEAKRARAPDKSWRENDHPAFLPGGRAFLFRSLTASAGASNGTIYVGSLDSGENRMLLPGASNANYAPPGFVIYGYREMLFAQRFNLRKWSPTGESFIIADRVQRHKDDNFSLFSTSLSGALAYRSPSNGVQLAWYLRDGARLRLSRGSGNVCRP
jgi:hypothetical protein